MIYARGLLSSPLTLPINTAYRHDAQQDRHAIRPYEVWEKLQATLEEAVEAESLGVAETV
jgi:hypothetical protein